MAICFDRLLKIWAQPENPGQLQYCNYVLIDDVEDFFICLFSEIRLAVNYC